MAATTQPIAIASDVSEAQPAGSTVVLVIGWVAASLFIVLPIVTTSVAVTLGVLADQEGSAMERCGDDRDDARY